MDPPIVCVDRWAFQNMILAAVETFKKECMGVFFGQFPVRQKNAFIVQGATAIQSVRRRRNKEVQQSTLADLRLLRIRKELPYAFPWLGYFHSHPEWGSHRRSPEMSDGDIVSFLTYCKDYAIGLEIIILISSLRRGPILWRQKDDGSVEGSLSGKRISLHAYRLIEEDGEKKPEKLKIVAPEAIKALNHKKKKR